MKGKARQAVSWAACVPVWAAVHSLGGQVPCTACHLVLACVSSHCACRTWLRHAELRRHKAARLSAARTALNKLQLARLLPAWQEVAAQQQHKHQQVLQAQQHYGCQLQRHMLAVWQENAAEAVVERLQLTAAAELHRLSLLAAGLRGLAWYSRWVLPWRSG